MSTNENGDEHVNGNGSTLGLKLIKIEEIEILNPRDRNLKKFTQIAKNVETNGLRRPITVTPKKSPVGNKKYLLVCGEGRIMIHVNADVTEIWANVIEVSEEQALLMGLVENVARRQHTHIEQIGEVGAMKERGLSTQEIAQNTGMDKWQINAILRLLKQGETRLLTAVNRGAIPISVAMKIAEVDDASAQDALTELYKAGKLKGKSLLATKRIVDQRERFGKDVSARLSHQKNSVSTPTSLLADYQKQVAKQKRMVQKARLMETRLSFVVSALKNLMADENFYNLARAESLDTLPEYIAARVFKEDDGNEKN